jgi:hypothetical protein
LADHVARLQAVRDQAARLQALRDQTLEDLDGRSREVESLTLLIDKLTLVGELYRALMDKLVLEQVRGIERVVTEGLKSIFFDLQLRFEADVVQRSNKINIDFFFRQGADDMAVRGHPLESFGGGPSSIASLVLRLLAILRLKRSPVIFLDETLGAVNGDEYIDAASQFLHKLAQTTGIDILYVSQKQGFVDHADVAYQASSSQAGGYWSLNLKQVERKALA